MNVSELISRVAEGESVDSAMNLTEAAKGQSFEGDMTLSDLTSMISKFGKVQAVNPTEKPISLPPDIRKLSGGSYSFFLVEGKSNGETVITAHGISMNRYILVLFAETKNGSSLIRNEAKLKTILSQWIK